MILANIAFLLAGAALGAGAVIYKLQPKLNQLAKLTDRDERGRFK